MENDNKEVYKDTDSAFVHATALDNESLTRRKGGFLEVKHNPSSFAPGLWSNKDVRRRSCFCLLR